jgi:hypothetical protein
MAKLKQFGVTKYYRGIELYVICVTTSQKKFAELVGSSANYIRDYAHCYEPRNQECIDNPDILFAEIGLGGEAMYVFERNKVLPYTEYMAIIDKHRETYSSYRDYLEKTGKN